jgi:sn-glycerol 3-phosphate transport system ATP-binding protein
MAIINGSSLKGFENYSSVGIRAENLHVSPKGKGRLVCEVSECEFLGSETFVGLSHPSAKGLTISMPGVQNIDQGKKLEITFADENLHFFDVNGDRTS